MPTIIVIWLAKLSAIFSKVLGRGDGSALPGLIAEGLRPDLLAELGHQFKGNVTLVTGTNGKTTTTRMITAILDSDGRPVLTNRAGSNLTRGILSTMILAANWRGQIKSKRAVFEVDEAAFAAIVKALKPKQVLILNLFRDQLDRYGELNTLASQMKAALDLSNSHVVLNADDPLVAWLGLELEDVAYFGLEAAKVKPLLHDYAADSNSCPVCGRALNYTEIYYAHIGKYSCPNRDFIQPSLNIVGTTTKVDLLGSVTVIKANHQTSRLNLELPGLYNVYNALAAVAAAESLKIELKSAIDAITETPAAFGRAELVGLRGRKLQLLLVKNPAGFNQVIQTYLVSRDRQPLLIVVNDLIADGRDVSWLWDVAFEDLPKQPILASGTRAYDLALRLKYADHKFVVEKNIAIALEQFVSNIPKGESGLILPTYTAMLAIRRNLSSFGAEGME